MAPLLYLTVLGHRIITRSGNAHKAQGCFECKQQLTSTKQSSAPTYPWLAMGMFCLSPNTDSIWGTAAKTAQLLVGSLQHSFKHNLGPLFLIWYVAHLLHWPFTKDRITDLSCTSIGKKNRRSSHAAYTVLRKQNDSLA